MESGVRRDVRAEAVCGCGSRDVFEIHIFACGSARPYCTNCSTYWSSPVGGESKYADGEEAVGGAGDESADLVSEEAGGVGLACPDCEAYRKAHAARMRKWRAKRVGKLEGGVSGETLGGPVKAWELAGVSKATWYRRKKEGQK